MVTLEAFGDEIGLTNGFMENLQNHLVLKNDIALSPDDSGDHQEAHHTAAIS